MYQKAFIAQGGVLTDPDSGAEFQLHTLPTWVKDNTLLYMLKITALYEQIGVLAHLCQELAHLVYLTYRSPLLLINGLIPLFGQMISNRRVWGCRRNGALPIYTDIVD